MPLRILLVEDHRDTRHALTRLLRHSNYTVVTASDYRAACLNLDESRFDVLLSDLLLPDGDGRDLVTRAKSKQPLVAIALTALATTKNEEDCFICGFDHYFVKPLEFRQLRTVLDRIPAQGS